MDMTVRTARSTIRAALVAALAAGLLAGCTETINTRGNLPDPKVVAQIEPGRHTRTDIQQLLGTPSTVATFEKEIWFYIGGRVMSKSFSEDVVLERRVLSIRFNKRGIVSKLDNLDATRIARIEFVERETPTKGKDLTILQQMIGNIGRFGAPSDDSRL